MKYIYPVLLTKDESWAINVAVPDLLGCFTFGYDKPDAIEMTRDAMSLWLCVTENRGEAIPAASRIEDIQADGSDIILVDVDIDEYRAHRDEKAVVEATVQLTMKEYIQYLLFKKGNWIKQIPWMDDVHIMV